MSGRWFRLYDELLNDPKVQRLPPWAFKMLINLWCIASKNEGVIPEEGLPYALHMRADHVRNGLLMLFSCGLLERIEPSSTDRKVVVHPSFTPHKWHIRNPNHKPSTERTRAYRERERVREREGTPLEVDIEVEVEVDKIELGAKAPPTTRRRRLPPDFQPRSEDVETLLSEGFSLSEIEAQLVRFRDYWTGTGKPMLDWYATFRNWVRKSAEMGRGPGPPPQLRRDGMRIALDKLGGKQHGAGLGTLSEFLALSGDGAGSAGAISAEGDQRTGDHGGKTNPLSISEGEQSDRR
jgi:hypothetical protein